MSFTGFAEMRMKESEESAHDISTEDIASITATPTGNQQADSKTSQSQVFGDDAQEFPKPSQAASKEDDENEVGSGNAKKSSAKEKPSPAPRKLYSSIENLVSASEKNSSDGGGGGGGDKRSEGAGSIELMAKGGDPDSNVVDQPGSTGSPKVKPRPKPKPPAAKDCNASVDVTSEGKEGMASPVGETVEAKDMMAGEKGEDADTTLPKPKPKPKPASNKEGVATGGGVAGGYSDATFPQRPKPKPKPPSKEGVATEAEKGPGEYSNLTFPRSKPQPKPRKKSECEENTNSVRTKEPPPPPPPPPADAVTNS